MKPLKKFLVVGRRMEAGPNARFYFHPHNMFDSYEEAVTFIGIEGTQMEGMDVEFAVVEVTK